MDSILMYFLISLKKKFKQSNFFIYILRERESFLFFKIITLVLIYIDFFFSLMRSIPQILKQNIFILLC